MPEPTAQTTSASPPTADGEVNEIVIEAVAVTEGTSRGGGSKSKDVAGVHPILHVLAVLLGWLLPGLGHVLIGKAARGVILGVTILMIYLGGIFIGGIGVIDSQSPEAEDGGKRPLALWFLGQALIAPSLGLNIYNHHLQEVYRDEVLSEEYSENDAWYPFVDTAKAPYEPSFSKTHEQGLLYTSLAGLLNLLVLIDLVFLEHRAGATEEAWG